MDVLPAWFLQFCELNADRFSILAGFLAEKKISYEVLQMGNFRHIQVRSGHPPVPRQGEKILIAHYDRVAGVPGANDNGASVLHLVEYLLTPRKKSLPLRVIFTDGEELSENQGPSDQGAFALAQSWRGCERLFPVVLDMTGVGDTFILGHLGQALWQKGAATDSSAFGTDPFAKIKLQARRILASVDSGDFVEINTPFSDDLGLLLGGFPGVQISLLPRKEALKYKKLRSEPKELGSSGNEKAPSLPEAWRTMHTVEDTPDRLWASSRVLMKTFLERLENFPLRLES